MEIRISWKVCFVILIGIAIVIAFPQVGLCLLAIPIGLKIGDLYDKIKAYVKRHPKKIAVLITATVVIVGICSVVLYMKITEQVWVYPDAQTTIALKEGDQLTFHSKDEPSEKFFFKKNAPGQFVIQPAYGSHLQFYNIKDSPVWFALKKGRTFYLFEPNDQEIQYPSAWILEDR